MAAVLGGGLGSANSGLGVAGNGTKTGNDEKSTKVVDKIGKVIERPIWALGQAAKHTDGLGALIKLTTFGFQLVEHVTGRPGVWSNLMGQAGHAADMMDTAGVMSGASYAINREGREDTLAKKVGTWAIFGAGIGLVLQLISRHANIGLGKIGQALGKIPVLGALTLGTAISGLVTAGFVCFGIDAAIRLVKASKSDDPNKKVQIWQALIDLAQAVAEVALGVIVITGALAAPWVIGLGLAAGSLGLLSFIHSKANEQIAKAKMV